MQNSTTRRRFVAGVGAAITVGLAGCSGDDEDDGAGVTPTDDDAGMGVDTDDPLGEETEMETETDDLLGEETETDMGNGTETPLAGEERGGNQTDGDGDDGSR